MKIVVLDGQTLNPGDLSWAPFERHGKVKVYERTLPDDIVNRAEHAEIVLTNKTPLNRETIRKLTNLKYIGVLATGYNVVNVEAAAKRNVVVTNVPGYSTASVAEHVFAMLLELARAVDHHAFSVRKGQWSKSPDFCYWLHPQIELAGRTIGIVGYGQTGRAVAKRALAFDLKVLVHTRTPPAEPVEGITFVALSDLLSASDIVSLHLPLTPLTENLINAERLALMKKTAWLVNTSRGGVIDEEALANALRQKRIEWAALDVLGQEPPDPKNPLFRAPHCMITPHLAWATKGARARCIAEAETNLAAFIAGVPRNVVQPAAAGGG